MSTTASMPVDLELKKAFQELQSKMVSTRQQLKLSDMQIEQLTRQNTHARLVDAEIDSLPAGTRTYEGVGRMFMLQPATDIKENFLAKVKSNTEKIKTIETNKTYLNKCMKESENSLREMVMSKRKEFQK